MAQNIPGESNAYMIYAPAGVFLFVCPALVCTRIWSRLRKGGKMGSDDWTIVASLIFAIASSCVMIASCYYGYGQHVYNILPVNKKETLRWFYVCQITYKASINLTKASLILLYVRIFGGVKWFKWLCVWLCTVVVMYCIASVAVTIFQCTPVVRAFDKSVAGTCIDNGKFWYANAGFSIATDVIILMMPIPLVWSLQIPKVQKAALIVVFLLGGFVVITSCLRITTINIQATSPDSTFDIASTMWTIIEMNIAIICACLPQLRPLIVKLFPKLMPGYSSRGQSKPMYGRTFSAKGYVSSHSRDRGPDNQWERVESGAGKNGIHLTSIRNTNDNESEEYILQNNRESPMQIHKTVQYSVEYSKEKGQRSEV